MRLKVVWFDSVELGVRTCIFSQRVPDALGCQLSGLAGCVPAEAKTSVSVGLNALSLLIHLYVTVPAALAVMLAVNSNFFGHEPV